SALLAVWLLAVFWGLVLPAQGLRALVAAFWVLAEPQGLVLVLGPLQRLKRLAFSVCLVPLPVQVHKPPCLRLRTKASEPSVSNSPRKPLEVRRGWPCLRR
ncbi:MAG TPA: hypothetical protein VMA55_11075, partial [Acidovorax sp.]|nr:hypothetical protein [Acidovorax sp.]